jgi:hypothetical protein
MNVPLASELEIETNPLGIIATKNRLFESYINKAKLKNFNAIIYMNGLGLTTQESMEFLRVSISMLIFYVYLMQWPF